MKRNMPIPWDTNNPLFWKKSSEVYNGEPGGTGPGEYYYDKNYLQPNAGNATQRNNNHQPDSYSAQSHQIIPPIGSRKIIKPYRPMTPDNGALSNNHHSNVLSYESKNRGSIATPPPIPTTPTGSMNTPNTNQIYTEPASPAIHHDGLVPKITGRARDSIGEQLQSPHSLPHTKSTESTTNKRNNNLENCLQNQFNNTSSSSSIPQQQQQPPTQQQNSFVDNACTELRTEGTEHPPPSPFFHRHYQNREHSSHMQEPQNTATFDYSDWREKKPDAINQHECADCAYILDNLDQCNTDMLEFDLSNQSLYHPELDQRDIGLHNSVLSTQRNWEIGAAQNWSGYNEPHNSTANQTIEEISHQEQTKSPKPTDTILKPISQLNTIKPLKEQTQSIGNRLEQTKNLSTTRSNPIPLELLPQSGNVDCQPLSFDRFFEPNEGVINKIVVGSSSSSLSSLQALAPSEPRIPRDEIVAKRMQEDEIGRIEFKLRHDPIFKKMLMESLVKDVDFNKRIYKPVVVGFSFLNQNTKKNGIWGIKTMYKPAKMESSLQYILSHFLSPGNSHDLPVVNEKSDIIFTTYQTKLEPYNGKFNRIMPGGVHLDTQYPLAFYDTKKNDDFVLYVIFSPELKYNQETDVFSF